MTENSPERSRKPIWWALVAVAAIGLSAWTYLGTKRSNHDAQQASTSAAGQVLAYNPTTGATVPGGAAPGALGTGPAGTQGNTLPAVNLPRIADGSTQTTRTPAQN